MPGFPKDGLLEGCKTRISLSRTIREGSDYIKVIADIPGPDEVTLDAIVKAAHEHKKLCIAHAASYTPYAMAQAGVDVVTHAPLDKALTSSDAKAMVDGHCVAVPTLIMMKGVAENIKAPFMDFKHASQSVSALHEAGVTILAGTDANAQLGSPGKVPQGGSLHRELGHLVEAGMSNVQVLRAATALPAQCFGLEDRGSVEIGKRADLLLLAENPIDDIHATKSILKVWCYGSEVSL